MKSKTFGSTLLISSSLLSLCFCAQNNHKEEKQDKIVGLIASGMKTFFHENEMFSVGDGKFLAKYESNATRKLSKEEIIVDSTNYKPTFGEYEISLKIANTDVTYTYAVNVSKNDFEISFIEVEEDYCLFHINDEINPNITVKSYGKSLSDYIYLDESVYKFDLSNVNNKVEGDYKASVVYSSFGRTLEDDFVVKVRKNYKEKLKILAIGNSFSDDSTEYLYSIAKSYGYENVVTGQMYVGGCTISQHRGFAESDTAAYTYRKNATGASNSTDNYKLKDAISDEDWDVITLQQGSPESGLISTYNGDINYLINYVEEYATNPEVKIAWHMTWAYQQNSTHASFPNYDKDQMTMYKSIVNAVNERIVTNSKFSFLLPSGTAIQNARTSSKGDNLTRDGHHLTLDTGRFIAGLCYFLPISGESIDDLPMSAIPSSSTGDIEIIKDSVKGALEHPLSITQSKYGPEVFKFDESKYSKLQISFVNKKIDSSKQGEEMSKENYNFVSLSANLLKHQLVDGSIIALEKSFRYQPVFWEKLDQQQFKFKEYTTSSYLIIDEKWWDNFSFVNFNISYVTDVEINANDPQLNPLTIYVPKPVSTK